MTEEAAAAWLEAQRVVDDANASRERYLAERAAREEAGVTQWTPPEPEPPKFVQRAPEPPQYEEQPMRHNDWNAVQTWVEQIIDQRTGVAAKAWVNDRLVSFAGDIGEETGKMDRESRELMRTELRTAIDTAKAEFKTALGEMRAEFKAALVEAELRTKLLVLEQRVAEAEQRAAAGRPQDAAPSRPKLIGSADAA